MKPKSESLVKNYRLTKGEQETITRYDMETKVTTIDTTIKADISRCKKLGYKIIREDKFGATFECQGKCVGFRSPNRKPRVKTEKVVNNFG